MRRAAAGRRLPAAPATAATPAPLRVFYSARHPDCTCGFDANGRWNSDCAHHRELNAKLDAQKDHRPLAVRQAEAAANVAAWAARRTTAPATTDPPNENGDTTP